MIKKSKTTKTKTKTALKSVPSKKVISTQLEATKDETTSEFRIEKIRMMDIMEESSVNLLNTIGNEGYELKNVSESFIELQKYIIFIFCREKRK